MSGLLNILVEALSELGDTAKAYPFTSQTVGDDKIIYNFKTNNGTSYDLVVAYEESNEVHIAFVANGNYSSTNNIDELYAVMGTIAKCIKDAYEKKPFDTITFTSAGNKGNSSDYVYKGAEQRTKLYQYYIKKYFPSAKFDDDHATGIVIAYLKPNNDDEE